MNKQISLFESILEKKDFTDKKIRLIECFAGIGSQYKALKYVVGDRVESYKIVEWAYNSILCYNAIHIQDYKDYSVGLSKEQMIERIKGISVNYNEPLTDEQLNRKGIEWIKTAYNNCIATNNLINIMSVKGKDLEIVEQDKYYYILTYSFPCQDLSLAGLGKGMSVSQADGGTRSGLLWEIERILTELDKENIHIDCLLMENVPQVIGQQNIQDFRKWENRLSELGYSSYCEILNAKDYGLPQNRQRAFMVSVYGEYFYEFPYKLPLQYKLKDFLEKQVDEKYYLSEKMVKYISADNEKWTGNNGSAIVNRDIGCTINTAPTQRRCDASNYICDDLPENTDLKQYTNSALNETIQNNEIKDGYFIDAYNRDVKSDIAGTITTRVSDSNNTFVAEKINETDVGSEYVGTYDYAQSETLRPTEEDRTHIGNDITGTILASGNQNGIIVKRFENYITWKDKQGNFNTECNRASLENDLCLTIACANTPKVAIKEQKKNGDKD